MTRLAEEDWLMAALQALGAEGIQAVRVEPLARRLGVTKGSFYHHFPKRQELLDRLLSFWQHVATEQVIEQTNASAAAPEERLHNLLELVFSTESGHDDIEGAIRDWAATSTEVASAVMKVDAQRIAYIEYLLEAMGVPSATANQRAHIAYRVLIGEFTWRRHGGSPLTQKALRDLATLLSRI